jgi:hypothetical protein
VQTQTSGISRAINVPALNGFMKAWLISTKKVGLPFEKDNLQHMAA